MLNIRNNEICADLWKIIAHFGGYAHQKEKAIEEFSELTEEMSRDLNGNGDRKNIAGEMADSYIMLAQLELIYGNHHDVVAGIREKLARTLKRVEAERTGTPSSAPPRCVGDGPMGAACYARREAGT